MGAELKTEVIKKIYDAALSEDRWQTALDHMVDATSALGGMLYEMSLVELPAYSLSRSSRFFHDLGYGIEQYNSMIAEGRGSRFDEEGLQVVHSRPSLKVLLDEEIFDMENGYYDRPEVKWCRENFGFTRRIAIGLSDNPNEYLGLIFQYANSFQKVPETDLPLVEAFAPHMAKAVELHRLTRPLRIKYRAVLSALDMIDLPIILFSDDGTLILKNQAAGDVLSARDALWLDRSGRLNGRHETICAALADAVQRMSETARGEGIDPSVHVEIARGTGAPSIHALVSPLRDASMELEAGLEGAVMTLIDPAYPARARVDLVAHSFGLSPAETRVAELIAAGRSNAAIAEMTNVSPETVKTQAAAIFEKTGTRGRIAFLWRVFQFSPPVR